MVKGLGRGLGSLIPNASKKAVRDEFKEVVSRDGSGVNELEIDKIVPNPNQPRKQFDHAALEELMASIKLHGILIPLIVTPADASGRHELIAGERRLRAAQTLGLPKVPVIQRQVKEQEKLELAIIENIQRKNLNPIEEALAYQRLMNEFNLTQDQVAEQLGKSRPSVANFLRLLELPGDVQKAIADGKISVGHAKILAGLKSAKDQQAYLEKIVQGNLSVRDLEQVTKKVRRKTTGQAQRFDPVKEAQEEMLRERLGTRTIIKKIGEQGQIVIYFYSPEELKRLLNELT